MPSLRQLSWVALLGICLAGIGCPTLAWSRGLGGGGATQESGEEPAHDLLYRTINFVILVGGMGYVLRKPLGDFLSARSASIRKALEEGRKALEASGTQLQAVEAKLQRLGEEIAAFQAAAVREMDVERQRLEQSTAEEAARILDSARAQMDTALRGARLELKNFTASQAVTLAEGMIRKRLDEPGRKRLVSEFLTKLEAKGRNN
jgi:F-type H+-transporting ATPase subunit b